MKQNMKIFAIEDVSVGLPRHLWSSVIHHQLAGTLLYQLWIFLFWAAMQGAKDDFM